VLRVLHSPLLRIDLSVASIMHIPSFIVGSMVSGGAYVLISQQLAFRERLTYQWPLAQWAEDQFRLRWREFTVHLKGERQQIRQHLNLKKEGDESGIPYLLTTDGITKKWNRAVDVVQKKISSKSE
jgi:hypothetical protein